MIPDKLTAKEFKELQKKGVIDIVNGKYVTGTLTLDYKKLLEDKKKPSKTLSTKVDSKCQKENKVDLSRGILMSNGKNIAYLLEFRNLPKISLNKWYAGTHWTDRKKIKDKYKKLIENQFGIIFDKNSKYEVKYIFYFKSRPLDSTNTVAMAKLIEDIIFEDDKYDIILKSSFLSKKAKEDYVTIKITIL